MKLFSFAAILLAFLTSCSSNVRVVDEAGYPIANARIIPASRSLNRDPVATNAKGEAMISQDIPKIEYLHIFMTGYQPARNVNFDQPKPIEVVLKRVP